MATVKSGVAKYGEAFDKTATNLLLGVEVQQHAISPLVSEIIRKLEAVKVAVQQHFEEVNRETNARIVGTVTTQEILAGLAALFGLLVAFLIARGITRPLAADARALIVSHAGVMHAIVRSLSNNASGLGIKFSPAGILRARGSFASGWELTAINETAA